MQFVHETSAFAVSFGYMPGVNTECRLSFSILSRL